MTVQELYSELKIIVRNGHGHFKVITENYSTDIGYNEFSIDSVEINVIAETVNLDDE